MSGSRVIKRVVWVSDCFALALFIPSQDPELGEAEASLTAAEESMLKREILKRDNIHATQVRRIIVLPPRVSVCPVPLASPFTVKV